MRLDDYRNDLNNIHCTPEFREKMIQQLSKAPDEEYADTVSSVEPARKISISRYAAIAASAAVVVGFSGLLMVNLKDSDIDPADKSGKTPVNAEMPTYEMNMTLYSTKEYENYIENYNPKFLLGSVPQKACEAIADIINNVDFSDENLVSAEEYYDDDYAQVIISIDKGYEMFDIPDIDNKHYFTISFSENGMLRVEQNNYFAMYNSNAYGDILEAQCSDFKNWDWDVVFCNDIKIATLFKENIDTFEEVQIHPDRNGNIPIVATADLSVTVNVDDIVEVDCGYYLSNINTVGGSNVRFQAPEGFYQKIADAKKGYTFANGSLMADIMASAWSSNLALHYHADDYTDREIAWDFDSEDILDVIKGSKLKQVNTDSDYMDTEKIKFNAFELDGFYFNSGYIYDMYNDIMYVVDSGSYGKIESLFESIINSDDKSFMSYKLLSHKYRYDIMVMDIAEITMQRKTYKEDMGENSNYPISGSGKLVVKNIDRSGVIRTDQSLIISNGDSKNGYSLVYTSDHDYANYATVEREWGDSVKAGKACSSPYIRRNILPKRPIIPSAS